MKKAEVVATVGSLQPHQKGIDMAASTRLRSASVSLTNTKGSVIHAIGVPVIELKSCANDLCAVQAAKLGWTDRRDTRLSLTNG